MKINHKDAPGFNVITENILVVPPLFGVPELDHEIQRYKNEAIPHKREMPEIMEGNIIEHTEIFKYVSEYLNTNYANNYIVYNSPKCVITEL